MASKKKMVTKFVPAGFRTNFNENLNDEIQQAELMALRKPDNEIKNEIVKANNYSQKQCEGASSDYAEGGDFEKESVKINKLERESAGPSNHVTNGSFKQTSNDYSEGGNFSRKSLNNNGNIISPPKTICRNKSLPVDNFRMKFNENVEFHDNTKSSPSALPIKRDDPEKNKTEANKLNKNDENNATSVESSSFEIKNDLDGNEIRANNVRTKTRKEMLLDSIRRKLENRRQNQASSEVNDTMVASKIEMNEQRQDYQRNMTEKCTTCKECDNFINCPEWCAANIKFNETDGIRRRTFLRSTCKKELEITRKYSNKMIIHGVVIAKPVSSLDDTFFDDTIKDSVKRLNCVVPTDTQACVWPASLRGLNIFMIGSSKTGKSLAYLPAFCSFMSEMEEKYSELSKYQGPLFVILCSNIQSCDKIGTLIKSLLSTNFTSPKLKVLSNELNLQNACNCDILITTPLVLEKLLISGLSKIQRLSHIAIEDAHVLLKNYSGNMIKLFKVIDELQANRPHRNNIQIIVSSQKWSSDIETLLKQLNVTPVVCFQDFLEAAMYGKIKFERKMLKSSHKLYYLDDILKNHHMVHRTVIFCDEKDILQVDDYLQTSGTECIVISGDLPEDEIFENENMWCSLKRGHYKVLLCTDDLFKKTHVLIAEWLVHLHLPSDWYQFSERFRAIAANVMSPLNDLNEELQVQSLRSFLIIDESNCNQFPNDEFSEFLIRNSVKHLHLL